MANMWHTIREFKTARFTVALQWEYERDPDLSWMDKNDYTKIESGEWTNCCFRVAVFLDGRLIATDYMGNSVYADPVEFSKEHFGTNKPGVGRGYFSDMLRDATKAARKAIHTMPERPRVRHA